MRDPRKILLAATVIILVLAFGITYIRQAMKPKTATPLASPSPIIENKTSPAPDEYSNWKLFRNGYAFPIPPKWKNTSDKNGVAILEPGDPIGSLQQISITILSDKKAPQGQQFTTQTELDQWSAVSGPLQGDVQKTKNITLDGSPGVMLVDTTGEKDKWLAMAWVRKDNINVQLRFTGNGTYSEQDMKTVDYIISHFTFTPPAMTGKEGK